jgi:outer membrane protein OmpA-like peptidoglycan-associated protein
VRQVGSKAPTALRQAIANGAFRALLAVLLLIAPGQIMLAKAEPVGTVVGISGECFVESAGQRSALSLGAVVAVGDVVEVSSAAKLKLRMNDRSILSLAAGAKVTIAAYTINADGSRNNVQLTLTQGLLRAAVTPVSQPAIFEVSTATGSAGVRSTDWFIEAKPHGMEVVVISGSVNLSSIATGVQVLIPANHSASVGVGLDPTPPRPLEAAQISDLIARSEDQPAGRVLDIERRAPIDLVGRVLDISSTARDITGLTSDIKGNDIGIAGSYVTVTGQETRIALPADILFDFNKSDLRPSAADALKRVAAVLRERAKGTVRIEGHTDVMGEPAYNQKLSERRAESVRKWLIEREGLGNVRFTIQGFGASRPKVPNTKPDGSDDPDGRQLNRRVELVFNTA